MTRACLAVVGWSGSGKTTLLERLIAQANRAGLTVNAVKHSHHDIITEPTRKDSARLRLAGAQEVLLSSPFRYVLTHELRARPEPQLAELIARLAPADLTLVEGYKWAALAKLEVWRSETGKPPLYPNDPDILAVASTSPRPADAPATLIWLALNDEVAIWNWLCGVRQSGVLTRPS